MARYTVEIKEHYVYEWETTSYQKVADTGGEDGGARYDHVPLTERRKSDRTIYSQQIEDLDLSIVIKAVNKL